MSIALAFDTHEFITTLESTGMPLPQAEAISHAVRNVHATSDAATKADLDALDANLRKDMDARFTLLETKFALQMDALQNKLLIKLSLVMLGLVGLLEVVPRFFPHG